MLFLLIFTHHCFSDALLENQIPKDLADIFHVWTSFCKRFSMDYVGFPLAREEWKGNMVDAISRGE